MAHPAEAVAETPGEADAQTPKSVSMESVMSIRGSFTSATTAPDADSSPLSPKDDQPWKLPSFALASPAPGHGKPMMAVLPENVAEELAVPQEGGPLPSPGSALHRAGVCRPCAWFHKAHGCANGDACRHCHLCSEDEIKARRKLKVNAIKSEKSDKVLSAEPLKVVPSSPAAGQGVAGLMPPPPGLPAPRSPKPTASEVLDVRGGEGSKKDSNPLPSWGSALHGSGECKPCAWLYKGSGCQNGKDCRHCHLCPDGEIRHRRKAKVATLRLQGESEDSSPSSGALAKQALQWQQAQHSAMLQQAQWEAQAAAAMMWHSSAPWDAAAQAALAAAGYGHFPQERLSAMLPAAAAQRPPFAPLSRTASGRSPHVVQIAQILGA